MRKNRKKWEKTADILARFGEMERNAMVATCEHNYGAIFSHGWSHQDHSIPR